MRQRLSSKFVNWVSVKGKVKKEETKYLSKAQC